tara:strand:+ start:427 stop:777 length:351 start_codon:yes stop_codon:yes gene_type:complete
MTLEDFGIFHETVEAQSPFAPSGSGNNPPHQSFVQKAYLNPNSLEREMDQGLYREIDVMTEYSEQFGLNAGDTVQDRWRYSIHPLSFGWSHPNGNVGTRAECFCVGTVPNPVYSGE